MYEELLDEYCLVRSSKAGCFAGVVEEISPPNEDGTVNVTLTESRQLWTWWCKKGVGLQGVASGGLADRKEVKLSGEVPRVVVCGCCQVIEASVEAEESIRNYCVAGGEQ